MARRYNNDGSYDRDAYARVQMYNDERRAVAARQRAVGDWSVEGGRGGIHESERNMSNQGSLRDLWRNGKIVQPGTGGQTPTGTQSRNSLNPAKTTARAAGYYADERRAVANQQRAVGNWSVEGGRGGIVESTRNMSNQGSLRDLWRNGKIVQPGTSAQGTSATQSQNQLNPAKTSTAATPGSDSGWDYTPTADNPFGSAKGDTVGGVMSGLSSVGALSKTFAGEASSAIGALTRLGKPLFVYSPEGQKTTSVIPDGTPSAGAFAFGRGIYYKPPERADGTSLPALSSGAPSGLSNEESSRNRVLGTPDTLSQTRRVLQTSFSDTPPNDIGVGGNDDYFTERIRRLNYPKGSQ